MLHLLLLRQKEEQANLIKRHEREFLDIADSSALTTEEYCFLSRQLRKLYQGDDRGPLYDQCAEQLWSRLQKLPQVCLSEEQLISVTDN